MPVISVRATWIRHIGTSAVRVGTLALAMGVDRPLLAQAPPFIVEHRTLAVAGEPGAPTIYAEPGTGVTLVFRVANPSEQPRAALIRLQMPEGWQSLFASEQLALSPRASVVDTVTLTPPRDATAGDYVFRYEARSNGSDAAAIATVTIHVVERHQLVLTWVDPPIYVPAGVPSTFDLRIANRGNVTERVTLDVRSGLKAVMQTSWAGGTMASGEERRVRVTRAGGSNAQSVRETLTALVKLEQGAAPAEASLGFQVVPEGRATSAPRERLPVSAAIRVGTERDPGFGSLVGGGPLNRSRTMTLRFGFLSAEQSHPLMLERDRNFASFAAPGVTLLFGDQTWSLSTLTESGHYGTGAGGTLERARWSVGGFIDTGRHDVVEGSQAGGFVGVTVNPFTNITAQYLRRFADGAPTATSGDMASVRVAVKPTSTLTGSVEVGRGQSADGVGYASAGQLSFSLDRLALTARRVRRDETYPIRDKTSLIDSASLELRPFGQLQLRGTLDGTALLDDRTLPLDAPTRQRASRAAASWGSFARVSVGRSEWTSPGKDWTGEWLRESASAELRLPMKRVWVSPGVEQGTQTTPATGSTLYALGWLSAGAKIGKFNTVNVRGELGRGTNGRPNELVRRFSLGAVLRPTPSTNVTLQVQNSVSDALWFLGTRSVSSTVEQELPWHHSLQFKYQSRSGGGTVLRDDKAYRLDYVVPFGVPLWAPSDGGRVTVRLRDGETGLARSALLLQIANQTRLTDQDGVATFSGLKAGEYLVNVEPGSIGAGRTVVPALPMKVTLRDGGRVDLNAMIIRTSRVRGRIQRFQTASGGFSPGLAEMANLVPGAGIVGALLDLIVNGEHRTATSDAQGRFTFDDVPPGTWTLHVVRADVPSFFRLEESDVSLTLAPGENREVVVRVVPKAGSGVEGLDQSSISFEPTVVGDLVVTQAGAGSSAVTSSAVARAAGRVLQSPKPTVAASRGTSSSLRPVFSVPPKKKKVVRPAKRKPVAKKASTKKGKRVPARKVASSRKTSGTATASSARRTS